MKVGVKTDMSEMIYDNIIEAVRSQNPGHVILNCLDRDGFAIRHQNYQLLGLNDGSIGILPAGFGMQFYRGESKVHDTCVASLYRINNYDDQVVALLKAYDFQLFLETTDEVQEWKRDNLHLDLWAICQHYEFATPMIDITSEIAVAAFFATHKFDWRINQYVLQKDGIGQIIGYFGFPEMDDRGIKLIGMQPFNRPGNQDGAGLWLGKDGDMIQHGFVLKFKQDEEINLKLERAMLVGADIFFPYEPVSEAAFLIKRTKVVTSSAVGRFLVDAGNWLENTPDEKQIREILARKNITMVDAPVVVASMLGNVRPIGSASERPIVRRPALDRYLRKSCNEIPVGIC